MRRRLVQFGLEELRFLRSFEDLKFFYRKMPFLIPRISGNFMRNTKVPSTLQLEPTNHCNLRCISCPRDRIGRKKGFIDYDVFKKIIDEAAVIGVKRVHLYLHGEPLLHPEIIRMIGYIKSKRLGINLVTNGMLLDRVKAAAILRSGVNSADYVTFSVLGSSREVHERIMRGANHDTVVENIRNFIALRKEYNRNGPIVEVILYKMPENEHEEKDFVDKWKGKVDHVHVVGKTSRSFSEFKKEGASIPLRTKSCKNLWERMTIYWHGDVTICCEDVDAYHVLGSLKEKTINEIWNSGALNSIKEMHRRDEFKKIRLCARCDQ